MADERAQISDPAMMRALAHPARLTILEHLAINEAGATATECAEVVGLSPSATSYHLRAMAKAGLIHEGPSRGDGRERVWQRKFRYYELAGKGENQVEELAMAEAFLAHQNDKVRRFLTDKEEQGGPWWDVASITESTLVMTSDELAELLVKIHELVAPYRRQVRTDPPPDARPVSLQLRGMPLLPLRPGGARLAEAAGKLREEADRLRDETDRLREGLNDIGNRLRRRDAK